MELMETQRVNQYEVNQKRVDSSGFQYHQMYDQSYSIESSECKQSYSNMKDQQYTSNNETYNNTMHSIQATVDRDNTDGGNNFHKNFESKNNPEIQLHHIQNEKINESSKNNNSNDEHHLKKKKSKKNDTLNNQSQKKSKKEGKTLKSKFKNQEQMKDYYFENHSVRLKTIKRMKSKQKKKKYDLRKALKNNTQKLSKFELSIVDKESPVETFSLPSNFELIPTANRKFANQWIKTNILDLLKPRTDPKNPKKMLLPLFDEIAIGMDCEWDFIKLKYKKMNEKFEKAIFPDVIQISVNNQCLLYQTNNGHTPPCHSFVELLTNPSVKKIWCNFSNDIRMVNQWVEKHKNFFQLFIPLSVNSFIDIDINRLGTEKVCYYVLGKRIEKCFQVSFSRWSRNTLSQDQKKYAAEDAYLNLLVYTCIKSNQTSNLMENESNVHVPVISEDFTVNEYIMDDSDEKTVTQNELSNDSKSKKEKHQIDLSLTATNQDDIISVAESDLSFETLSDQVSKISIESLQRNEQNYIEKQALYEFSQEQLRSHCYQNFKEINSIPRSSSKEKIELLGSKKKNKRKDLKNVVKMEIQELDGNTTVNSSGSNLKLKKEDSERKKRRKNWNKKKKVTNLRVTKQDQRIRIIIEHLQIKRDNTCLVLDLFNNIYKSLVESNKNIDLFQSYDQFYSFLLQFPSRFAVIEQNEDTFVTLITG